MLYLFIVSHCLAHLNYFMFWFGIECFMCVHICDIVELWYFYIYYLLNIFNVHSQRIYMCYICVYHMHRLCWFTA